MFCFFPYIFQRGRYTTNQIYFYQRPERRQVEIFRPLRFPTTPAAIPRGKQLKIPIGNIFWELKLLENPQQKVWFSRDS